jgi:hypothetical protein
MRGGLSPQRACELGVQRLLELQAEEKEESEKEKKGKNQTSFILLP